MLQRIFSHVKLLAGLPSQTDRCVVTVTMQPEKQQPSTSKTCNLCKTKHKKCSRTRPKCYYCQKKRADCVYSDFTAHRVMISANTSAERTMSTDAATAASAATRGQQDGGRQFNHEVAMQNVGLSGIHAASTWTSSNVKPINEDVSKASDDSSYSNRLLQVGSCEESSTYFLFDKLASFWADKTKCGKDQILKDNEFPDLDATTLPSPATSLQKPCVPLNEVLPDKAIAARWLITFLREPNVLFRICDEAESWRLLDSTYAKTHVSHASECSIWFQLAVGCSYTTGTAPKSYDTLFETGKRYLEWSIEQDDEVAPLWVVPPMLLICLYSMSSKPKTCWLTLGAAIRIAQVHNLDMERHSCPSLLEEEYGRWREVWRAMISLDSWLSTTMGKQPQINQSTTQDNFVKMTFEELALPSASVEVNIAKLSVLISRFLTSLCRCAVSSSTQKVFFHALEEWASSLPQDLDHVPDVDHSLSSESNKVGVLYLELFYLATVILLTEPCILALLPTGKQQKWPCNRQLAQACINASTKIGHTASDMLDRGFICRRSWLVTTLTYHAGLVLVLGLSLQTVPNMFPRYSLKPVGSHHLENQSLEASMRVLSSCAPHNPLADHFYKVLHYFRELIKSCEKATSSDRSPVRERELFATDRWSPTPPLSEGPTLFTPSSVSSLWASSQDVLPSTNWCYPLSSSHGILAGPGGAVETNNVLPPFAGTEYLRQSISDPTCFGWTAALPNHGSYHPFVGNSGLQAGIWDPDSVHYDPYMQNLWPTEMIDSGQTSNNQDDVHTQYG